MNLYLTGGWGYGNIGDEAILMGMLRSLDEQLGRPQIVLTSFDPLQTQRYHGLKSLPSLHRLLYFRSVWFLPNLITLLTWAFLYRITGRHFTPSSNLRAHIDGIEHSDLVVMGGGGYFNDLWWQALPARLAEIWLADVLDKKIMIYGQTVGPFNTMFSELFFGRFLNRVDFITYRDAQSEVTLSKYGYEKDTKSLLTADEANLIAPEKLETSAIFTEYGLDPGKPLIGIMFQNFRPYESIYGTEQFSRIKSSKHYLEEVEKALLCLHRRQLANVLILPSTTWDTPFCSCLYSRLSPTLGEDVQLITDCGVQEYASLCQNVDVMISTNMHPIILATTNSVPSIAISYFYKMDDFMRSIGQEKNVWRIDRFDHEEMIVRCEEIIRNNAACALRISDTFEQVKVKASLNALATKALVRAPADDSIVPMVRTMVDEGIQDN